MRHTALRYGLANMLLLASAAAIISGGWPIYVVLGGIYAIGGPLDEGIDQSTKGDAPSSRWFCGTNLYLTLPFILLLAFAYLRLVAGRPLALFSTGPLNLFGAPWDGRIDIAAATFLVGSCYAIFGATVAHELTHCPGMLAQRSARWLLAFMWNTSFTIFHIHTHHRCVGTLRDPATARRGESIFAFIPRTIVGQYVEAYRHEAVRLRRAGLTNRSWRNRFVSGQLSSLMIVAAAAGVGSWEGVLAFAAAALIGRIVHESINYIQHYGLVRIEGAPIAARHTWDSYRPVLNSMSYNLPRHSAHHLLASKPFWELTRTPDAPILPHGYMLMVLLASVPTLWRRVMAPRLADWDRWFANDAERAVIAERGWKKIF